MTAPIITEFGRDAYGPLALSLFSNGVDGDTRRRRIPGQLWDREAEREPAYSVRLGHAMSQSVDNNIGRGHSPLEHHPYSEFCPAASGIIRAGIITKKAR